MKLNALLAAFSAFAGIILGAYARTVSVASQTDTSVTFAFGAADGLDYELFFAHGAADGDEDKYAWDGFEKVADVAYDQTTYTYEVPENLRDGRLMRFFLMQTIGVNMAKELDYARSTSAQWVDTGIAPAGRTMVDFRFGDPVYANQTTFFGRQWAGTRYLLNQQSNEFRFHGNGYKVGGLPTRGVDYRFVVDDDSCCHLWTDGVETTTYDSKARSLSGSGNIAVFGCNDGTHNATFSFYRMKIFNNGTFQADLIPAMDADGNVGLYDNVNNRFCKNQTATPLEAGNVYPQARFGRVVDSTPSFKFRRSLTVASATANSVELALGNPDGAAYKLYIAYGASDCAADKNAWTSWFEVATIAADATSYTYTLPAALKADGVFFRFFLVKTDNLPYASELASIASTGAQGIRTGYIPDASTTFDFKFGALSATNDKAVFGQSWYWGGTWLFCYQSNALKFGGVSTTAFTLDSDLDSSADYNMSLKDDGTLYLSHADVSRAYSVTRAAHSPCDLTLFSNYPVGYGSSTHYSQYRFYSMTLRDGGLVVRDLVPVQTAAGKGALFDSVTGTVFENMTSTDFTKGAAVARQGWVFATSEPCYAGSASGAPTPVGLLDSITLTEDTEWTSIANGLADNATIDLNGYELHIADYSAFCAKYAAFDGVGSLRVTVPADETLTFGNGGKPKPVFTGNLVKDGAGTLVISQAMTYLTGVTVASGIVKYGAQSVIANGITVKVLDGGALDMNGNGNGNVPIYDLAGTGPDGVGALRNTGGDVTAGSAQMKGLTLSANAKVGGTANLGQINSSHNTPQCFDLNGYTLTIDIPSNKGFWLASANSSSPGTIYVKSGILYPYKNDKELSLPNVDVIIDGTGASYRIPSDGSKKATFKSITAMNGGSIEERENRTYLKELTLLDGSLVPNYVKWIYVANTVIVSNETTDITIYPPIEGNSTYSKLLKYGAGTLYIKNNHTDQKMHSGAEIFGGTVVMDSTASTLKPEIAISSSAVPVTIHAGGTLDMSKCTNAAPFKVTTLIIEEGGTLLHAANNTLSIAGAATYTKPMPFGTFNGTIDISAAVTFDLTDLYSGDSAPAAGTDVMLLSGGAGLTTGTSGSIVVNGCPYEHYVTLSDGAAVLHTKAADAPTYDPIKIWNVGGTFVYGANGNCYRRPLAEQLTQIGWNVQMTGWRTANASAALTANDAWKRHSGIVDLALKTSATRAGILEGLETYAAAANEPDFTIFVCGDKDVADGVSDAMVLANYKAAVTRIKAALPMTTVIACTIPGGSATLNADIAAWCATEADVEAVDISSSITAAQTQAECEAVATAIKTKLTSLATANGKNNPSTWTRPTVTLGAENNVPSAYLDGFTRVRSIEPTPTLGYAQNLYAIPYAYAPVMQETGIAKVGYYIELVRKDTGALQALWFDMDAPGTTWADIALPVTHAQRKQQTVTKLHVWSNFGGVTQIPANDDSVEGYIEFNPINYNGNDRTGADIVADPWANAYGVNDTMTTSGSNGHGCFQFFRKFTEANAFPVSETLFAYNGWGNTSAGNRAIGMGTIANFSMIDSNKSLDWTFVYGAAGSDAGNISASAYSFIRIDFWVKYTAASARTDLANFVWAGTDGTFATVGNWKKGDTVATSLANMNILLPENANQSFNYVGWDPVNLSTTVFMVDGMATFPEVGGFYLAGLDMGATGKLVYDPTKFTFRLVAPPVFVSGAKIALTSNYAANTKGRFLLMTWNNGSLDMDAAALNAIFDTTSAQGADVKVWAENLEQGGRLWLDLNYSAAKDRVNVLCVGDSITQGSDSSYGNWRTGLMKKLAAAGYDPVAKGHWKVHSADICGAVMPEEWVWHSGISGQRLVTKGGGGTIDAIETMLDCAGDVDFILVKLCTNDINSNNATAAELFPVWTNLVWKVLNQKPHAKFIAGAVVDMADKAAKNEQVIAYNAMMKNAIEGGMFPAKRTYFSDLYTPCYRYDGSGNFITGSFQSATDLHPDWPGEDKMAATYCATIEAAIADDFGFELGAADTTVPTTSGAENNVPADYLSGMTRARVFDIAANGGTTLTSLGYVPYSIVNDAAPAANLSRVGYYIELKRRDDALNEYHGLTRWIWVSMDAFGDRTLDDVGIPLTTINQCVVSRLRVKTNMPGIESTASDATDVRGWIEFWPSQYNVDPSGKPDAPAKTFRCDWNDIRSNNMSGYGSMQVHRFTPGEANPAQVMFAFNRWSGTDCYEIGIGNFSHNGKSIDYTWMGDANTRERMSSLAYEVAKIEIWTASDTPLDAAFVRVDEISSLGSDVQVTGEVVNFGESATSATVTLEWSTDPTFATVTGSTSVGEVAEPGAVTATVPGLAAGETWYFRFTSVNSANVSAASAVSDPYELSEGVWRPQTTADVWTSIAWLKNGTGSPVAFNPAWSAKFDGNETTKVASVQVPEHVTAKQLLFDSAADYTLTGSGLITSEGLVKKGSGTLTLGAAVLADTPDIEIQSGTVKLGDDAVTGAAGQNAGTITVKNGGQFDLNYIDTASANNRPRAQITSQKKFVIEGSGPDGNGAIKSSYANTYWSNPLGLVQMTGDATIGGSGRIDLRGSSSNNAVIGPDDATLTVKVSPSSDYGLYLEGGQISVGKLVVPEEGKLGSGSNNNVFNIPNGIDLYGLFRFYNGDPAWNVGGIYAYGTNARIGNNNGTAYVRTPLTVTSDTTLTLDGSATMRYTEVVTNKGEIAVSNGNQYLEGPLVNEGNPVFRTGRTAYVYPSTVQGDSRLEVTGGNLYLSGRSDWGDATLDVTLSGGGGLVIGTNNDGYGMPKFGKNKLSITAASGHSGVVYFHPATSATIDGLTINGPLYHFRSQGQNPSTVGGGPVVDIRANDLVFSANNFEVGTGNGRGELTLTGANTHIAVKGLYTNWRGSQPYAGSLIFTDGLLEVGSGGIQAAWAQPARTVFNMENGTLRATDNFNIGKAGMTATFGSPKKGGKVTFDLNGKNVKWGTGLAGASDVTLTGSGKFAPDRPGIQGIPLGKWTVDSTGTVDFKNAAGFAGGLTLSENANVTLDIAGTNMVEFLAWTWSGNAWNTMQPAFTGTTPDSITPFVATSLTYFNRKASAIADVKYGSGSGFNYLGEFYVSEEQEGTWYFTHNGVVHNGLQIDNVELDRAGKNTTTEKSIALTAGWHKFLISIYCDAANQTIGPRNSGTDTISFKAPGDSAYTVFDSTTIPLRMRQDVKARTSVRWRKYINPASNLAIYDTVDESEYAAIDVVTNSLQVINVKYSTGTNAPLGGACTRFDGYFKVEPEQEGTWTFQGRFDDQIALDVDGRRLFTATSNGATGTGKITLRAGWHKFDIRLGDNSTSTSGGSGGYLTDANGNTTCALMFMVNGGVYNAFDERYLPIAYTPGDAQKFEQSGLGGDIDLAAGSTLVNAPRENGFCPIYGTVKGSGTFSGPFRFTGDDNCWEISGDVVDGKLENTVSFVNADPLTLAGLKRIRALFDGEPTRSIYKLAPAPLGLTEEAAAEVELSIVDDKGKDYSEDFALVIEDGKLWLRNKHPKGTCVILM
ncbi:MAG: hypothetical protein IJU44_03465 [Kiritimatiellae bacterium]|nr:hypothetical protein [Kiritimatiellia bacterium]